MENYKFQCLSKRNKSKRDACIQNSDVQEVDMYVLEEKGFTALWVATQKQQGLNEKQIDAKPLHSVSQVFPLLMVAPYTMLEAFIYWLKT